jgi:D-alanyl-D-alanine carboxypeptidase
MALAVLLTLGLLACGDAEGPASPTATVSPTSGETPSPAPAPTATGAPTATPTLGPSAAPTPPPTAAPTPAGNAGPLTPVSKQLALPAGYVPPDLTPLPAELLVAGFGGQQLRTEAASALASMLAAAASEGGFDIRARSSYRSYAEQEATFQYWVDTLGLEEAERISARPGHSEHQLGTTSDLTAASAGWDLMESFGDTAEGQWLAANAHRFGFALSYPAGKEAVTGYAYEPWHYRYIGPGHASAWKASGLTLIEYLLSL